MQLLGCTLQWIGGNVTVDGASRVPTSRQDNHQNSGLARSGTVWVPDLDTDSNDLPWHSRDTADTSYNSPEEQWAYMLRGSSGGPMALPSAQLSPSLNTSVLPTYNAATFSATYATSILHWHILPSVEILTLRVIRYLERVLGSPYLNSTVTLAHFEDALS